MSNLVFNKKLQANNVFEMDIDYDQVMELAGLYSKELNQIAFKEKGERERHIENTSLPFFAAIPQWKGDIAWVSAASKESFQFFDDCFETLDIAKKTKAITGLSIPLIMYSGFFVIRSYGREPYFHNDFFGSGINAFTLMTPIQLGNAQGAGHLLYKNTDGITDTYQYRKGKAIIFGSDFTHSTEPFESKEKFIFLCFTYGCQDLEVWEQIKRTAANQGVSHRHPQGNIVVTNPHYEKYF